jgi:hypothetical protein
MALARTIRHWSRPSRRPSGLSVGPDAVHDGPAAFTRIADDAHRLYRCAPLVARGYGGTLKYTARRSQ